MNKRLLVQLVKEFWVQMLISVVWTSYTFNYATNGASISVAITHFSAAFFFTSWIMGQYIRIKKQQKIEDEFGHVKGNLQNLLKKIEDQTKHLIGHTTGGDSIGYFTPSFFGGTTALTFIFTNNSEFPVFDAFAEWIDLDQPIDPTHGIFWTRHRINLGTIHPHKALMNVFSIDMNIREKVRINIFIYTRNRNITQQVKVIKVNNILKIAVDTTSENFKETRIPTDFPEYDPQQPEKVFQ